MQVASFAFLKHERSCHVVSAALSMAEIYCWLCHPHAQLTSSSSSLDEDEQEVGALVRACTRRTSATIAGSAAVFHA